MSSPVSGPAASASLSAARRQRELAELAAGTTVDLLVVGLGVTGAGVALDAAARGLTVAAVDAHVEQRRRHARRPAAGVCVGDLAVCGPQERRVWGGGRRGLQHLRHGRRCRLRSRCHVGHGGSPLRGDPP